MKILLRKDIDTDRWDQRIAESEIENVFCYSWYLDAVAAEWCGLVSDNYKTILPIPYTVKLGVKQMYNAPFCREYDIFGQEFNWQDALEKLEGEFKGVHFRNSAETIIKEGIERHHQWLPLTGEFQSRYRTNAKRLIKKGKATFTFQSETNTVALVDLFRNTAAKKIDSISEDDLSRLLILMDNSMSRNQGELITAYIDGRMVAGGFFLKDKSRITYLKGAAEDGAKKQGVMFALLDFAFERYSKDHSVFDFGGSDVEAVATFYRKFGAEDRRYFDYQIDRLPVWFRTLKKLKS